MFFKQIRFLKRILGENCKIEHSLKAVKTREMMIHQLGEEDGRFKQRYRWQEIWKQNVVKCETVSCSVVFDSL